MSQFIIQCSPLFHYSLPGKFTHSLLPVCCIDKPNAGEPGSVDRANNTQAADWSVALPSTTTSGIITGINSFDLCAGQSGYSLDLIERWEIVAYNSSEWVEANRPVHQQFLFSIAYKERFHLFTLEISTPYKCIYKESLESLTLHTPSITSDGKDWYWIYFAPSTTCL